MEASKEQSAASLRATTAGLEQKLQETKGEITKALQDEVQAWQAGALAWEELSNTLLPDSLHGAVQERLRYMERSIGDSFKKQKAAAKAAARQRTVDERCANMRAAMNYQYCVTSLGLPEDSSVVPCGQYIRDPQKKS